MRNTIAAVAAGLLLASAPAFAGGDHNRINSAARTPEGVTTPGTTNADGTTSNTRTARSQIDNSNQNQQQNQSAGEATPAAPDAGVTPQSNDGRVNGANAPAQPY